MCLAEALLRVPDKETADRLIRDKLADGDWRAIGNTLAVRQRRRPGPADHRPAGVDQQRAPAWASSPSDWWRASGSRVIRRAVDRRFMLGQFVTGPRHRRGPRNLPAKARNPGLPLFFRHARRGAMTAADAERYFSLTPRDRGHRRPRRRGVVDGDGISVKLSALHPRYTWRSAARVMAELLPKLLDPVRRGQRHDIGLNIDAEETDRLTLSLASTCSRRCRTDELFPGWTGLGFAWCRPTRSAPRKCSTSSSTSPAAAASADGAPGQRARTGTPRSSAQDRRLAAIRCLPRKVPTDVSYLACAKSAAGRPTPSTRSSPPTTRTRWRRHPRWPTATSPGSRATTSSSACTAWANALRPGQAPDAPPPGAASTRRWAATTLLAYLVRRLLENGANTSFVEPHRRRRACRWRSWSPTRSSRPPARRRRHASGDPPAGELYRRARAQLAGIDLPANLRARRRWRWRAPMVPGRRPDRQPAASQRGRRAPVSTPPTAATRSVASPRRRPTVELDAAAAARPPDLGRHPAAERAAMLEPRRRPLRGEPATSCSR